MDNKTGYIINPEILRQYDVRGVVGKSLKEKDCYFIGRSFGTYLANRNFKTAVIGYDGRESSELFANEVIKGLVDCGINVKNIGLNPTPAVFYTVQEFGYDAGVIVTGSHSPLQYNGIKMVLKDDPFYGEEVSNLGKISASGNFAEGKGSVETLDVVDSYVERLVKDFNPGRKLKIAWDNGNGAAGEILRRMVKKLPGEHILMFDEIDGTYPNHHADPSVEKNMLDLMKVVKEKGCDVGIAFDGDADRVGAVDEKGNIVWCDILLAVYAAPIIKKIPGAKVVFDVKCSRVLFDEIKRLGGEPVVWTTGAATLRPKMKEVGSPIAGELSGHMIFADKYYGYDDGIYCGIRLIDLLANSDKTLSELYAHLPKMKFTPEVRYHVPADRKFLIADEIKARLIKENIKDLSINDIDGIRVTTPEGWWLIRASNTEDLLTIRAEGFDDQSLEKLKNQVIDQLSLSGIEFNF